MVRGLRKPIIHSRTFELSDKAEQAKSSIHAVKTITTCCQIRVRMPGTRVPCRVTNISVLVVPPGVEFNVHFEVVDAGTEIYLHYLFQVSSELELWNRKELLVSRI